MSIADLPTCIPHVIRANNLVLCILLNPKGNNATNTQVRAVLNNLDRKVIDCLSLCAYNILTGRIKIEGGAQALRKVRRHKPLLVFLTENKSLHARRQRLRKTSIPTLRAAFAPIVAAVNVSCAGTSANAIGKKKTKTAAGG